MIELTNIKATDTVGQLRRQINSMQNEIMRNQPMIGTGLNVVDDALTVDATATQAGITANTTWSELESAATQP